MLLKQSFFLLCFVLSLSAEAQIEQYRSQSARITISLNNQRQNVSFKTLDAQLLINLQNGDFALRANLKNLVLAKADDSLYSKQLDTLKALGEIDFAGNILGYDILDYADLENFKMQLNGQLSVNKKVYNKAIVARYFLANGRVKDIYATLEPSFSNSFLQRLSSERFKTEKIEIEFSFKMQGF
jgi:hypothetical protein